MNADTGQGVAIMANSDNGILVADEYIRSLAKEYGWKNKPEARSISGQMMLIGALKGADAVLSSYEELEHSGGRNPRNSF